jgi:hypothetical protein
MSFELVSLFLHRFIRRARSPFDRIAWGVPLVQRAADWGAQYLDCCCCCAYGTPTLRPIRTDSEVGTDRGPLYYEDIHTAVLGKSRNSHVRGQDGA